MSLKQSAWPEERAACWHPPAAMKRRAATPRDEFTGAYEACFQSDMESQASRLHGTRSRTMLPCRRPVVALVVLVLLLGTLLCWKTWAGSSGLEVRLQECVDALKEAKKENENLTETSKMLALNLDSHRGVVKDLFDKKAQQGVLLEDFKKKLAGSESLVQTLQRQLIAAVEAQVRWRGFSSILVRLEALRAGVGESKGQDRTAPPRKRMPEKPATSD